MGFCIIMFTISRSHGGRQSQVTRYWGSSINVFYAALGAMSSHGWSTGFLFIQRCRSSWPWDFFFTFWLIFLRLLMSVGGFSEVANHTHALIWAFLSSCSTGLHSNHLVVLIIYPQGTISQGLGRVGSSVSKEKATVLTSFLLRLHHSIPLNQVLSGSYSTHTSSASGCMLASSTALSACSPLPYLPRQIYL